MFLTVLIWSCISVLCTAQSPAGPRASASVCIAIPPEGEDFAAVLRDHRPKRRASEPSADDQNLSSDIGFTFPPFFEATIEKTNAYINRSEAPKEMTNAYMNRLQSNAYMNRSQSQLLPRGKRGAGVPQSPASLQLFVWSAAVGTVRAGESSVPAELLAPGNHVLTYAIALCSEPVSRPQSLSMEVTWDGRDLPVSLYEPYTHCARFNPHHVTLTGPHSLRRAAMAVCVDDMKAEASTSDPPPSTLGAAALCSAAVMAAGAALAFALSRRYYTKMWAEQQDIETCI